MPKRADIGSVFVIGAGPIVIGQACEFDYSGTQACRVLKEEGIRTVLLNSNPATIMTDPNLADATYIEPIDADAAAQIIEAEKADAVLPTMGGQTALNCAMELARRGVFGAGRQIDGKPLLIGASAESIHKAEDREAFKQAMERIGLRTAPSAVVGNVQAAMAALEEIGFPVILRPSFTLGGSGGGVAHNNDEFYPLIARGLAESPNGTVLMERSLLGWKEFEMEVVRDRRDNCIIVCAIENVDPMGVHTGDSITVAPAQTLTDKEYQRMRNAAIAVLREIGVDTGGANVQFAVNPVDGDMVVIEMNPRVSRSSALASKATGFPIAKAATRLAIGFTLDEVGNDITGGKTPASFEPSLDYVVVKIPRFDFDKFAPTPDSLTTQMRSVGEVMAIGRTFSESLQKAARGLETGADEMAGERGYAEIVALAEGGAAAPTAPEKLARPHSRRLFRVLDALRGGMSVARAHELTRISEWFLRELEGIVCAERDVVARLRRGEPTAAKMRAWKRLGISDRFIGGLRDALGGAGEGRRWAGEFRDKHGVWPVYKRIDTCAGEFPTDTAYLYSAYEDECELAPSDNDKKIVILGSGPNRIGQGIEFDYCCAHGVMALKEAGYETIMVNCNPETVSTDYDIADRLFFEPLTIENVADIIRREKPSGVIVQFGGQTPLSLAAPLAALGAPIIGTPVEAIDRAESRERFQQLLRARGLRQPDNAIVGCRRASGTPMPSAPELAAAKAVAMETAAAIGYPLVARPSYVLGGRRMRIVRDAATLAAYLDDNAAVLAAETLLDRFLEDAIEVDVDAVRDADGACLVAGVMEHIERAGVHSGDSACSLPPLSLADDVIRELRRQTREMADALGVVGMMNAQFAIHNGDIYVLEANPRASRTAPFVSKATGLPLAKIAAKAMVGIGLAEQGVPTDPPAPGYYSVKEAVFPFNKFPDVDVLLGPEMKSTGESMGIAADFPTAFLLAQKSAMPPAARAGGGAPAALFSVRDADKPAALECARMLAALGHVIMATEGTARHFSDNGLTTEKVGKVKEGGPHIVDLIISGKAQLVVNTVGDNPLSWEDSLSIRRAALSGKVVYYTTMSGALAGGRGLQGVAGGWPKARSLQAWRRY